MSEPLTALVVDDEEQLLRLTSRVLERAGHRVLTAASAELARELFAAEAEAIDLVLLDVVMPRGDGAAKLMPEMLSRRPGLRVILTSGDELPDELRARLERVRGGFLRKPFAPRTLLGLLDSAASTGKPRTPGPPGPAGPGGA